MSIEAYDQLSSGMDKMFVVVAGNIGSGKTTLTKKLSERLNWKPHYESVQDNPYLSDFYDNMSRWSFPLQVYFLNHRFNTHKQIEYGRASAIQDRSIYEDANNADVSLKMGTSAAESLTIQVLNGRVDNSYLPELWLKKLKTLPNKAHS